MTQHLENCANDIKRDGALLLVVKRRESFLKNCKRRKLIETPKRGRGEESFRAQQVYSSKTHSSSDLCSSLSPVKMREKLSQIILRFASAVEDLKCQMLLA
jgi:hypothetical protein